MKHYILKFAANALLLALAFAPASSLVAQDVGSLAKQAQSMGGGMGSISSLTQKLHLNPQQIQQVMPILEKEVPKLQSIMGNTGLSKTQKTEQTKAVQNQSDSKLKSILSPEQFTSLKGFRSEQLQSVLKGVVPQ
jgi:hypothetical protein